MRIWTNLPRLVRFILRNIALGVGIGWTLLAAILWSDMGGLYSLISHSSNGFIPLYLLFGGFAVTFGPAAVATAVLLGHEFREDDDIDKASKAPVTPLRTQPARAAVSKAR